MNAQDGVTGPVAQAVMRCINIDLQAIDEGVDLPPTISVGSMWSDDAFSYDAINRRAWQQHQISVWRDEIRPGRKLLTL